MPCIGSPFPQTAASNSSLLLLALTLLQRAGVVISRIGALTRLVVSPFLMRYASSPVYLWLSLLSSMFYSVKDLR